MIRVIRVLAGIAPCDVHLAGRQVDDHGADRAFAVERVVPLEIGLCDYFWLAWHLWSSISKLLIGNELQFAEKILEIRANTIQTRRAIIGRTR